MIEPDKMRICNRKEERKRLVTWQLEDIIIVMDIVTEVQLVFNVTQQKVINLISEVV